MRRFPKPAIPMKRSAAIALSSLAIAVKLALVPVAAQSPATGAVVQAQPRGAAAVWIYAWRAGQPAPGIEARIGARLLGVTTSQGVVGGAATVGPQTVEILDGERRIEIPLDLAADEQVQIAVQFVPGRAPVYTVRSSRTGTRTVDLNQAEPAAEPRPDAVLEAVEVVGEAMRLDDQAAFLDLERMSVSVDDTISIEQIARAGDTDAAVALRRVTGLTLVNDRFIYVRGLGERYSSVLLNGASIPSPDPTRRVVPLDLFPTDVLEGVVVQKTYTADMPGEFGGGTIKLRTRSVPLAPFFRVSATVGGNQGTTFEDGLRYAGGTRDWTGRDDGTRAPDPTLDAVRRAGGIFAPRGFANPDGFTPAEIEAVGERVAANGRYDTFLQSIGPDLGAAISAGQRFEINDEVRLGLMGAVRYSQGWETREEQRRTFQAAQAGLALFADLDQFSTTREIDVSAFTVLGLELGADHRFSLTSMLVRQTEDETRETTGLNDAQLNQDYRLEWVENSLLTHQLAGSHLLPWFGEMADLQWQYTDAFARRFAPNLREYGFSLDGRGGRSFRSNEQSWANLDDDLRAFDASFEAPFGFADGAVFGTVKLNAGRSERERDAYLRRYRFNANLVSPAVLALPRFGDMLVPGNIGPAGFVLEENTQSTDNYVADQRIDYVALSTDITFNDRYRINLGLRREANDQGVSTFDILRVRPPIEGRIDEVDLLPAFGATWMINDEQQLRLAWSRTLSRPDFRELSAAPFLDPILDILTFGNPELVTASITNMDLRWERYFSSDESFSVALFRKQFDNPIEKQLFTGAGLPILTYANADSATNQGIEFDLFHRLGFANDWFGDAVDLSDWFVAANYAWIESEIRLDPARSGLNTNLIRPLEGQSPYVVNLQVGYNDPDGVHDFAMAFNRSGERIVLVGIDGQPDVYEQPVNSLDFNWRWQFAADWSARMRVRNLLDPAVRFLQDDSATREFSRGREIAFSIEWSPAARD